MAEASIERVTVALKKRESFIRANVETLTVKKLTRLLEEDLGLPTKSLAKFKDELCERFKKILEGSSSDGDGHGDKEESEKEGSDNSDSDENVAEEEENDDDDNVEEPKSNGKKRKPPSEKKPQRSKKIRVSPAAKELKPKAAPVGGPIITKLKKILKDATIKISPNIYSQNRDVESLTAALTSIVKKHGLSLDSTPQAISRVKSHLEKTRDLEGIDAANIVATTGRRPRRAAARVSYKMDNGSHDSEDEEETPSKKKKHKRHHPNAAQNGTAERESAKDESMGGADGGDADGQSNSSKDADGQSRSKKRKVQAEESVEENEAENGNDESEEDSEGSESDEDDTGDDDGSDFAEEEWED